MAKENSFFLTGIPTKVSIPMDYLKDKEFIFGQIEVNTKDNSNRGLEMGKDCGFQEILGNNIKGPMS